jgi:hypothetical protein
MEGLTPEGVNAVGDKFGLAFVGAPVDADLEPGVKVEIEAAVDDEVELTFGGLWLLLVLLGVLL